MKVKRIFSAFAIGLLPGLLMAILPSGTLLEYLNAPAMLFSWIWTDQLNLPPHSEARLAVPFFAVLAQWFIVGVALSSWHYRNSTAKFQTRAEDNK